MSLSRRDFIKLLASGALACELDLDRLLWVPGEKTIFIPPDSSTIPLSHIVAMELERMLPKVRGLFERDDIFYRRLKDVEELTFTKEIRVPLSWRRQ